MMRDDALRRWPVESYVEVAAALVARGHEVVLAGGPGDRWASPQFSSLEVVDLIGQLSLLETVALLDSADVTVTHDTGPLHLAGLTRTAIVSLFGPTDPRGRLPQRAGTVALWGGEGFACRPCYDGRDYAPCLHNGCIRQVTPVMVLGEVSCLLRAIENGQELPPPRIITPLHTAVVHFELPIVGASGQSSAGVS
jgi:heptosyltransferase II